MADDGKKTLKNNETGQEGGRAGYKDSDFIPIDDLVYAPLHALALSNQHLREQVVDEIKSMGTVTQEGDEKIIKLDNINIAYEQVCPDGDEGYKVDNLQMQVPLLSIIPITNLNVETAEIDFSTEVNVEKEKDGKCSILARICSPEQRDSDFLPRVSYRMKVKSIPATEGLMRIIDQLDSNQIAKRLDSTPVAVDGNLGSDEQKNVIREVAKLRAKVKKLKRLHHKIADMISEQESAKREFDKDKYLTLQSEISDRIMDYQENIINREIEYGMDMDYE